MAVPSVSNAGKSAPGLRTSAGEELRRIKPGILALAHEAARLADHARAAAGRMQHA